MVGVKAFAQAVNHRIDLHYIDLPCTIAQGSRGIVAGSSANN